MRKLKLYLETSVWNFYFADDAPEKMDVTKEFFELVFKGVYDIYVSRIVFDEVMKAPDEKRSQLLSLIGKCSPFEIDVTEEVEILAKKYMERGVMPAKKKEDALHVGVATVAEMDAVITWNYKHMASLRKEELFQSINLEEGYTKQIQVITPMGVTSYES